MFACVAPFAAEHPLLLELAPDGRRLHVFVLDERLSCPAADCTVELYSDDPHTRAAPPLVSESTTDELCDPVFESVPARDVLVCAPGATPQDQAQHVQRVIFAGPGSTTSSRVRWSAVPTPHTVRLSTLLEESVVVSRVDSTVPGCRHLTLWREHAVDETQGVGV